MTIVNLKFFISHEIYFITDYHLNCGLVVRLNKSVNKEAHCTTHKPMGCLVLENREATLGPCCSCWTCLPAAASEDASTAALLWTTLPRSSAQVRACMKPFITFAAWWQWTFGTYWPYWTRHSKWKLTTTATVAVGCAHVHSSSLTLKACKSEIRSSWAPSKRYHLVSVRRLKPEWHMSNLLSSEGLGV